MKHKPTLQSLFFFFLFSFFSFQYAFAQLQDDFNDGNFNLNPTWSGDDAKFEVNAELQLHLNAPAVTDTAYLTTPSTFINDVEWKFLFILDFSPSGSNYTKIYLVSDQPNLKGPLNGYFVRGGKDGSDDNVQLYLQQGTAETLLLDGDSGTVSTTHNEISVKVTRDGAGNWTMHTDPTGGTNYVLEGSVTDNTVAASSYFGFFCKYTSTRSTSFYFDDVYVGPPIVDLEPPHLVSVSVTSENQLDVLFSEPLEPSSAANASNYTVDNGIGNPAAVVPDGSNPSLVHLTFSSSFPSGLTSTLTAASILDLSANVMTPESLSFSFFQAQYGDIIISEIMADPEPSLGLPETEYVEIHNISGAAIDLTGWTFSDNSSTKTLSSFILQPDSFLILCDEVTAALLEPYGNVMGTSSFPSMNNDGDQLLLTEPLGDTIDFVNYTDTWYQVEVENAGGVSLERISLEGLCTGRGNWHASIDSAGGTPGKKNSVTDVIVDTLPPAITEAFFVDLQTIKLILSESVDSLVAADASNYAVNAEGMPPLLITSVSVLGPDFTNVLLTIDPAADSNQVYTIVTWNQKDCTGNIQNGDTITLAIPLMMEPGDVVINEILFDPLLDGYDYLEIFNLSDKIFDLQNLVIANANDQDSIITAYPVTTHSYLMFPDQYVVITENSTWVKQNYFAENPVWFIDADLPTFSNDESIAVLLSDSIRIDQLHYFQEWHFPLLDDVEGVSLERIDPTAATQDSMNWHSAASTVGFGTPSHKNSSYLIPELGNEITVSPQVFSPDQDGFNDILAIGYQFDQPGYTANVRIFDASGREIMNLVRNALLDQQGSFTWDGITSHGDKARIGTYIVYVEVFDLSGNIKHYKKVCVVAARKS